MQALVSTENSDTENSGEKQGVIIGAKGVLHMRGMVFAIASVALSVRVLAQILPNDEDAEWAIRMGRIANANQVKCIL